jgi:hypothetical protein
LKFQLVSGCGQGADGVGLLALIAGYLIYGRGMKPARSSSGLRSYRTVFIFAGCECCHVLFTAVTLAWEDFLAFRRVTSDFSLRADQWG